MRKKELELYVHIPFCVKKCSYCDFLSVPVGEDWGRVPENFDILHMYLQKLHEEIRQYGQSMNSFRIISVFFGGGTPSILPDGEVRSLMEEIRLAFPLDWGRAVEITIEANPGTVTEQKYREYREAGINRISFGLQSVHDEELKGLGRIHTYAQFEENYHLAREAGFTNINIDLMSAIPHQTMQSWMDTLVKTIDLAPEHISAYSLIVEPKTPFGAIGAEGLALPDEDTERQMYYDTKRILAQAGYARYEISNYAKPGFVCRHNCGYWQRKNYLGLGLEAASMVDNIRWNNASTFETYRTGEKHRQTLSRQDQMEETMFLGLRMMEGVSCEAFESTFGERIEAIYGKEIEHLTAQGLLVDDGQRVCLTERGIDVSNYVMEQFLFD